MTYSKHKLKPWWVKTTIPTEIKIKYHWKAMSQAGTYTDWLKKMADMEWSEEDSKYYRDSQDTYKKLSQEISEMPISEVLTLPQDLQSWIKQVRPQDFMAQEGENKVSAYEKAIMDHRNMLVDIALGLIADGLQTVYPRKGGEYWIGEPDEKEEITEYDLRSMLIENLESTQQNYGIFKVNCFFDHLTAEFPDMKPPDTESVSTYTHIERYRILANRKTFEGTCPICKSWK